MKKTNLMVTVFALSTLANANYHKKETSVIDHSYISTPKSKLNNSCACANKKKRTIVNKNREKKFVSATFNSVEKQASIN